MSDLLIRDVKPAVAELLKKKAIESGRSVQAEVKQILERWQEEQERRETFWEKAAALRESIGPVASDSTLEIREDRDTDHGRDDSGYRT